MPRNPSAEAGAPRRPPELPVRLHLVAPGPEGPAWRAAAEAAGLALSVAQSGSVREARAALRGPLDLVLVWDDAAGERAPAVLAEVAREGVAVPVVVVPHPEAAAAAAAALGRGAAAIVERDRPERLPGTIERVLRGVRLETRADLTGRIAHELNNLLAPIPLAVQLLRRSSGAAEAGGRLEAVAAAARRSMAAVKGLSALLSAPLEAPLVIPAKHLLAIAARRWRGAGAAGAARAPEVLADYPPDLAAVRGDLVRLLQVLSCLARRALDGAAGGELLFQGRNAVRSGAPAVELRVACGPREDEEPPEAAAGAAATGGGSARTPEPAAPPAGAAAELGEVREVVEAHGGTVEALAPAPGRAGFTVLLPAVGAPAGAPAAARPKPPEAARRRPRTPAEPAAAPAVLVIESDEQVRRLAVEVLEGTGFEVLTAADGTEGVAVYAERAGGVAAVLVGARLRFMDGPATIKALRRIDPAVPMILTTGAGGELPPTARRDGPDALLRKPLQAGPLLEALRKVLA